MGSFNTPIPPGGGGGGPSGAAAAGVSRAAAGFAQQQQHQHQYQQQQQQPVAILWDIENCPVPGEMNPEEVAGNVRMALGSMHSSFRGAVTKFSAYGDFNHFPRKVREGCHRTGINLNDVPNSKKNASDKAILVDMFLFALDNPPPCTILLITGDVDFAPALHKLGQRGYTVVLAIPSGYVSGSLCSAGRFVWDWASVARGHGLVPAKTMTQSGSFQQRDNPEQTQRFLPGVMFSDESGDEGFKAASGLSPPIPVPQVSHGYSMGFASQSSGEWGFLHHPPPPPPPPMQQSPGHWTHPTTSMPSSSSAVPVEQETLDDPGSPGGKSHTSFVQPGDLSGLKRQLVKLLSLHGGKMLMNKVPPEYCKFYGRPLYIAEYGSRRLVHLIEKMQDTVCIKGEGTQRRVQLTSTGKRMAGRYKKLWGSACKSTGKNAVFDDDDDDDDDGDGDGDERENEVEEQEVDSREAPKEESKSMVDEELVVYVSKLDVSHESDSGASPDDQGSEQQQEAEEVIEIQEVVESSSSSGSGGGGGGGAASAAAAAAAREGFKRELQELLVSFQYHIPVSEFLRLYRQRYCKEPEYAAFGVDNLEELLEKIKDVAVLKGRIPEKRVMVANVGFVETED